MAASIPRFHSVLTATVSLVAKRASVYPLYCYCAPSLDYRAKTLQIRVCARVQHATDKFQNTYLHIFSVQAQDVQQPPSNIAHTVCKTSVIVESLRRVLPLLLAPYPFLQCPGQEQIMPRMVGAVECSPARYNRHARRKHPRRME